MSSEYIAMRGCLESRSGEKRILFLKMFMFVSVGYRFMGQVGTTELGSEEHFGELVVIGWRIYFHSIYKPTGLPNLEFSLNIKKCYVSAF